MRRVVVAGRWDGARPFLPTGVALGEIGQGVLAGCADAESAILPFGAGPTFDEAVAASRSQASFVRVPTDVASTRGAGELVATALGESRIVVEGGHNASPDCGLGFLAGLLGVADSEVSGRRTAYCPGARRGTGRGQWHRPRVRRLNASAPVGPRLGARGRPRPQPH